MKFFIWNEDIDLKIKMTAPNQSTLKLIWEIMEPLIGSAVGILGLILKDILFW